MTRRDEAHLFEIEIPRRHANSRARGQFCLKTWRTWSANERGKIRNVEKFLMRANAARGASPNGVQNFVKQQAAFERGEAGFGGFPRLRARRAVAKALKGHCDCAVRTLEPP